ncbi:MAG TPA: putative LPS assembly protein LptD [Deltaproteobacteria bacterium]|nr:putative LPS assembly protein LptD [Deltaproteobacteria bacterium]HPP80095.1 putative LPS assembly protein LptD [Deltaproteobacteria bacterium]
MLDVEADSIKRDRERIEAWGNVIVKGRDVTLTADRVTYDTKTEEILATGSCRLEDSRVVVRAETISYNAQTGDLVLGRGSLSSVEGSMRITGESIERFESDHIRAQNVEFTSCLGEPPDWSLFVGDLDIPLGGYGQGRDVRFRVRDHTLVYFPWLFFPAKFYRHSGVLFPEMGHGSDYGYRLGLPLYLVLSRSADMTVTPTYLSQRGLLVKAEARYCVDAAQSGFLYLEGLKDREGGQEKAGTIEQAPPDERWFLKARHDGTPLRWDVNLASTADYFRDIGAFMNDNPLQERDASPELNDLGDSRMEALVSRAQWAAGAGPLSWSVSGIYTQDLTVKDNGLTVQQLPRTTLRLSQWRVPTTPLMTSAGIGAVRAVTQDASDAVENDAWAELAMPVGVQPYFTITPSVREYYRRTRTTSAGASLHEEDTGERWQERKVTLSTALYGQKMGSGLRHQVVPGVTWLYRSERGDARERDADPGGCPWDIDLGRIDESNDVTVSLANYLRDASGGSLADLAVDAVYDAGGGLWHELEVEANVNPARPLSLKHLNLLQRSRGRDLATVQHSTSLVVSSRRGDSFSFGYEYLRDGSKLLRAQADALIAGGLAAGIEARYDHEKGKFEEHAAELRYTSQCWAVSLTRRVDASDDLERSRSTWSVNVKLLGVGDVPVTSPPDREG